jgi:hypothetical protein
MLLFFKKKGKIEKRCQALQAKPAPDPFRKGSHKGPIFLKKFNWGE